MSDSQSIDLAIPMADSETLSAPEAEASCEGAPPTPEATCESAPPASETHGRRRRRRGGRGRRRPAAEGEQREADGTAGTETAAEPIACEGDGARGAADGTHERPTAAAVRDDGAPADIDPARLDPEGIKILNRLHRYGHEAYFVGGCVRDLLLDRTPKDFDIATSAHPGEVRSLFRNCRLIGRRFRLAHVFFRGGKLIEVATFRANPIELEEGEELPEDLLITRDNVFGTAEEDARRRDFTINGLFYDIRAGRVIDYVGGLPDLESRTMRTIGDPEIRMREDPVRLLRAVRFAAKLGMDFEPRTYAAMEGAVEDLPRCAPARLLEEVFKLLRAGSARESFRLLHALGALDVLLPPLGAFLRRSGEAGERELFARLGALDARTKSAPVEDSVIVAVLLAPMARESSSADGLGEPIDALLEQFVQTARLPRRIADRARQLLWAEGVLRGERKRRRSLASFRQHPIYPDALALLEMTVEATGKGADALERWRSGKPLIEPSDEAGEGAGRKRRRRRRSRRRPTAASDSAQG
ncbi:MAG: polynucleotide adenylyltransferase PcnB [Myxococcales bacterium]|jgi:poly(A) polymerase